MADGMTPIITITDAPTAYLIASALRAQADANRRAADRLSSPAYVSFSSANMRNAHLMLAYSQRLDAVALQCELQGLSAESDNSDNVDTVVIPRDQLRIVL